MARRLIWTLPALEDQGAIADYIALDDPNAAGQLVRRVFVHVERLIDHPELGRRPPEVRGGRHRELVEPGCRIFYRFDSRAIFVVHVMRGERRLRPSALRRGD